MTWNLHDGKGDIPRFVDDLSSGRITGQPVRDYVLLLQEAVDLGWAASRGLTSFHVPVFTGQPRPRGTAVVSTLPLQDAQAIDLPHERQHRVAAAAAITVSGVPMVVVSAHFENRLDLFDGGPFADGARGRQAEALVDALPASGHAIVGGDLNTMLGPSEPALRILGERFRHQPSPSPGPTFRDRLTLDHLFFDLAKGWTASRRVVRERYGSDHHPVIGVVTAG